MPVEILFIVNKYTKYHIVLSIKMIETFSISKLQVETICRFEILR
jgi:hypothetical protein